MGAQKKKAAKFIAKGHLSAKIKQRNQKRKFQALKDKRKSKYEDDGGKNKSAPVATPVGGGKKEESDMMNDMDVDDFLNGALLDSDAESDSENQPAKRAHRNDGDDGGSSSEEEDEDALDPRYMTSFPSLDDEDDDDDEEEEAAAKGDAGEEDGDDDDDAANEAGLPTGDGDAGESVGRMTLTMEHLIKVEKACFEKQSVNGVRQLVKIFSDACRSSDAADVSRHGEIMYDIQSSAVYNHLMLNVFRKMHVTFTTLVGSQTNATDASTNANANDANTNDSITTRIKIDERKWKKHSLVIKRFFSCVCYVLAQTTGQDIQSFVLRELSHYLPFVVPCVKTASRLLRTLLKLWAKSLNHNVCMLSFVRIRELALLMPFPFLETALKGLYIAYTRNTKFTNEATLPHHVLLGNCVVELYGLDLASSYQHAFVYIRELAITIRKTITSPGPDSFQAVLNWQFFNQLRVWTAVICAYPGETQLHALVYPLCQLLFAVVRLSSTLRFTPMRFQCIKLLQQLAFATHAFIPTSPALLEVLTMQPFSSSYQGKHSGGKGKPSSSSSSSSTGGGGKRGDVDLDLAVKLAKSHLDHKRVHDQVIARLFELLHRECDVYKFHIGFPEFTVPLLLALTKFSSTCRVARWNASARGLMESLKKRADWIRAQRNGLDFAPKDLAQMDAFLRTEREAAVAKLMSHEAKALQQKMEMPAPSDAQMAAAAAAAAAYNSDSDADEQDGDELMAEAKKESDNEEEEEGGKTLNKKQRKRKERKRGKKQGGATTVDDATADKVKNMSLHEFKKSVAAVDAADVVEDFSFSSDEE